MKRRTSSLLLAMLAGITLFPGAVSAENRTDIGTKAFQRLNGQAALLSEDAARTTADLEISSLAELEAFRDSVNSGNSYKGKTILLTADIDMSENYGAEINGKEVSWTPIGLQSKFYFFQGSFNGNGHKITGLYINTDSSYQGLFGAVYNATISNLSISGAITSSKPVGGIAGSINDTTIRNCSNAASISGPGPSMGGIVGLCVNSTILSCSNSGAVGTSESAGLGGIAGSVSSIDSGTIIKNCYNTGTISGRLLIGGIAGMSSNTGSKVVNCYNTGSVSNTSFSGAIAGDNTSNDEIAISITGCYYLENTASGAVNGSDPDGTAKKTAAEFALQATFTGWNFDSVWEIDAALGRPVLQPLKKEDVLLGDVNNDKILDSMDALAILKYYIGLSQPLFLKDAADVNKDQVIDSKDALAILKHEVELELIPEEYIFTEIPAE